MCQNKMKRNHVQISLHFTDGTGRTEQDGRNRTDGNGTDLTEHDNRTRQTEHDNRTRQTGPDRLDRQDRTDWTGQIDQYRLDWTGQDSHAKSEKGWKDNQDMGCQDRTAKTGQSGQRLFKG